MKKNLKGGRGFEREREKRKIFELGMSGNETCLSCIALYSVLFGVMAVIVVVVVVTGSVFLCDLSENILQLGGDSVGILSNRRAALIRLPTIVHGWLVCCSIVDIDFLIRNMIQSDTLILNHFFEIFRFSIA